MKIFRKYFVFFLLGTFSLVLIVLNRIDANKLKKRGVYLIEKIYDLSQSNRGTTYEYFFCINSVKSFSKVKTIARGKKIGDVIFLWVLLDDPQVHKIINWNVPYCVDLEDVPIEGWKELPKDTCSDRSYRLSEGNSVITFSRQKTSPKKIPPVTSYKKSPCA